MNHRATLTIAVVLTFGCRTDSNEPAVVDECELVEEVALALDGTAPDGRDIRNWVDYFVRSHSASLLWADGERTGLEVDLTDPTNVRWRDYEVSGDGDIATSEIACDDSLAVDVAGMLLS